MELASNMLGNGFLLLGLLCFVGGTLLLVTGASVNATIYALGALGLVFVGAGASLRHRSEPPTT